MNTFLARATFLAGIVLLPLAASADTFREIVEGKIVPFGDTLAGLLYALAFLYFMVGMVRYFFIGATNEEAREKGKNAAIWGLAGLVLLFGLWGFVRLLLSLIGVTHG